MNDQQMKLAQYHLHEALDSIQRIPQLIRHASHIEFGPEDNVNCQYCVEEDEIDYMNQVRGHND